jgi:Exonuclease III
VIGDFNLHHPYWGGENATRDTKAGELLDIMEAVALDNWLPEGVITRVGSPGTTIDLVLATTDLRGRILNCQVDKQVHTDSDHLPIHTLLDIRTKATEGPPPAGTGRQSMERSWLSSWMQISEVGARRWIWSTRLMLERSI